jgi:hypothetical protein
MRKISQWRYLAVNRKTLFAALACALLVFSMLGCGATNHLQSITLQASSINGTPTTSQPGFYDVVGDGSTVQLQAMGNYTNGQSKDITSQVTFQLIVDPNYTKNAYGGSLLAPCVGACQSGQGTAQLSVTGLVTAVEPATCTWVDPVPAPGVATWYFVGAYQATASTQGITSQPVYIPLASQAGNPNNVFTTPNLIDNNPTEQCGPISAQ